MKHQSMDQNGMDYTSDCVAMQTPSSLPNQDIQVRPHLEFTLMNQYDEFNCFDGMDFGASFGETMPSLSGIQWAMLDLPDYPQASAGATEVLRHNVESAHEIESQPPLGTIVDAEIEPRQFKITTITRDAPLVIPEMGGYDVNILDDEDRAHVEAVFDDSFQPLLDLAIKLQKAPFHPPFQRLVFPPAPVMNVFIQLYFEHFHPLLPVLHKPTFSPKTTHWLLLFVVASIGSRYSKLPDAEACSLAMFELGRRVCSYMVSIVASSLYIKFDIPFSL